MPMIMLDRDGVLNQDRADYVKTPEELVLVAGAAAAVARLNRAGVTTVVVTNQGGVGRGLLDEAMLESIHQKLNQDLARENARLDHILYCADHPDRPTQRRKPAPGMLREALDHFGASAAATPLVGDSLRDLEAAAALGCPRILVRTGHGEKTLETGLPESVQPVTVHDDLAAAVEALLGENP